MSAQIPGSLPPSIDASPEPAPVDPAPLNGPHVANLGDGVIGRLSDDPSSIFVGSRALLTALYETYEQHIGIAEPEGPDGPYMWCACGWRSDDLGNVHPGSAYAVHLANAQHAAAVEALQPIVRRVMTSDAEIVREHTERAWDEGFRAGWEECRDPEPFVNDWWDSQTPNPYRAAREEQDR